MSGNPRGDAAAKYGPRIRPTTSVAPRRRQLRCDAVGKLWPASCRRRSWSEYGVLLEHAEAARLFAVHSKGVSRCRGYRVGDDNGRARDNPTFSTMRRGGIMEQGTPEAGRATRGNIHGLGTWPLLHPVAKGERWRCPRICRHRARCRAGRAARRHRAGEAEGESGGLCAEKARLDALDADLAALIDLADLLAGAALLAAGFHQHKRQWRRKRHGNANRYPDRPDRPE